MSLQLPKSVEEFVLSPWYVKVQSAIKAFNLNEDVQDTMQDILLALLDKNYLARWDASKGSFSGWLYTFVNNILRVKYNRSNSSGGRAIEKAMSFDFSDEDNQALCDFIPLVKQSNDFHLLLEEIHQRLDSLYVANSSFEYLGVVYQRDLATVFDLLVIQGLSVKDVSVYLGTSPQFIYSLLQKIRPVVLEVFDLVA